MSIVHIANRSYDLTTVPSTDKQIGFPVVDTSGVKWVLTESSATVDHTTVETVGDDPTKRWVKEVASGALILVEQKIFTADAASYTFSGLAGDTDVSYEWEATIIGGSGAGFSAISVKPNNLTTNLSCGGTNASGGTPATAVAGTGSNTAWIVGYCNGAGLETFLTGRIGAKTGVRRLGSYFGAAYHGTAASRFVVSGQLYWADSTTGITSLVFSAPDNAFGAGSVIRLYKRP